MTRWKISVEYDGGPYVGWQRQANGLSVQEAIETAISALSGEIVTLRGAGRTDAGVHALAQIAHFDLARAFAPRNIVEGLNFHLRGERIAILGADAVAPDFDARFSAIARRYRYRIVNRTAPLALWAGRAWHVVTALDENAMAQGARHLLGRHDFTSFRATHCQAASPVKTLDDISVVRDGENLWIEAKARSFLHHQVRNMVGSLKLVGEGKWHPDEIARVREARARGAAGPTAPAHGLYLAEVSYGPSGANHAGGEESDE